MRLISEDIDQFLKDRPRSDSYRDLCRKMLGPLEEQFRGKDLTDTMVKNYARRRFSEPSSVNTFLAVVKSWADWKVRRLPQGDLAAFVRDRQALELIQDIRRERVVTRLERKELYDEEMRRVYGSVEGAAFDGLWCLGWFGCRPGELVELDLKAIDKKPDRYLPEILAKGLGPGEYCVKFLTEKTVVERAVFMDGFTKGHLEAFIRSGRGYQFLYKTCEGLRKSVGVDFSPKWFRSTFQTRMQRALAASGVPMVRLDMLVKVMSGHTVQGDITGIYTDFGSDIKRAMTELHFMRPLEKSLGR